jgi:small subunit ribosomal protein S4
MARYTGPKDKLSRREGVDLFGKGSRLTRLNIPPGVHGQRGYTKTSQYARQLREKQKVKRAYGILEKQFRNYVTAALKTKGNTADALFSLLERRLDNVIYRLGLAPTRPAARQMVSHRQVLVNNKKVNIPSFLVSTGDTVTLTAKASEIPAVKVLIDQKDITLPKWLSRKAIVGKMVKLPEYEDVLEPVSAQDIIEFYSR